MTRTPEGFLICFNVPIARAGIYKYLSTEIGLDGETRVLDVHREPQEVFDQIALASFEGKAFTNDHPSVDVTADNWNIYSRGEISNVHRGTGEFSDYVLADIIVRDPVVADMIWNGTKREVSAGYECEYVERNGVIYQTKIRGNHVALVNEARAGHGAKIRDDVRIIRKHRVNRILKKAIQRMEENKNA